MLNFKNYLLQCLIEGSINVVHKENLPQDGEEYWNLVEKFLNGEYVPGTDIEARNITKWANERNIGKERLLSLFDRLTNGNPRINSRTHATEAMVGLAQNAHKDDPSYTSHREALLNKGGRIAMEAQKPPPLKVRSAATGESISYKKKESNVQTQQPVKQQPPLDTRTREQKERDIENAIRRFSAARPPTLVKGRSLEREHYDPMMPDIEDYGTGYNHYRVGSRVNVPNSGFRGITSGTIAHSYSHAHGSYPEPYTYDVRYELPEDHEDAWDENGEPETVKYGSVFGSELNKHNKKKEAEIVQPSSAPAASSPRDKITTIDPNTEVSFSHESDKGTLGGRRLVRVFATSPHGKIHIGSVLGGSSHNMRGDDDVTVMVHPHGPESKPEKVSVTSGSSSDIGSRIVAGVKQIRQHYEESGHIPTDAIDEQGFPIPLHRGGHEKGDKYRWEPTGIPEHGVMGVPAAVHNRKGKSIVELVDENGRRHFVHADELSSLTDRRPVAELYQTMQ